MPSVFQVPLYKKMLSYIWPVRVHAFQNKQEDWLELLLYRGGFQLGRGTALYSDATRYRPFRIAFKAKEEKLRNARMQDVLVLGAGLGSIVQILKERYQTASNFDLVDCDAVILAWVAELFALKRYEGVHFLEADAAGFLVGNRKQYDLVCVDVFDERYVPFSMLRTDTFREISRALKPGGWVIMNYIARSQAEQDDVIESLQAVFGTMCRIEKGLNQLFILEKGSIFTNEN